MPFMRNNLSKMKRGRVLCRDFVIHVWVAGNVWEQMLGLSRISPAELGDMGMLFIHDWDIEGFHMPHMMMSVDIAFMDDVGNVTNIGTMARDMKGLFCPTRPAIYALELAEGRLKALGVKPGDRFVIKLD